MVLLCLAGVARAESPRGDPALSDSQQRKFAAIRSEAKAKAAPLALRLAALARQANANMLADQPDEAGSRQLGEEIRALLGELLDIRIRSIKDTARLLTPQQRVLLRAELAKPGAPADLMELMERTFKLREP